MAHQTDSRSFLRRIIISEILIAVLVGAGVAVFLYLDSTKPTVEAKETERTLLNVDVYRVDSVAFQELLTGFGTARADREVTLTAQVTGEITEVHPQLKVGHAVRAANSLLPTGGPTEELAADVLARIDQRDYLQQVEQAETRIQEADTEIERLKVQSQNLTLQLEKATSVLATLKEEFDRADNGFKKGVATPAERNRALLEVQRYEDTIIQLQNQADAVPLQKKAAEQRKSSASSQKSRAENDLQRTIITPPFDGTLSEIFGEQGKFVTTGEPIARLTDLSRVEIPVAVSFENQIQLQAMLKSGERPRVGLAVNETATVQWHGHLVRVAPEADPQSRTVQAFVELDNRPDVPALLPGAFVHARIEGPVYKAAIMIPRETILNGSVFVVDEHGLARKRAIETGRRFQSLVIVRKGLEIGDRVVLTNLDIVEEDRELIVQNTFDHHDELRSVRSPTIRLVEETP